jgi:biotin operon repressor
MNALDTIMGGGTLFTRVALGQLAKLPHAARVVYEAIHVEARKGREIPLTDREFARQCGIGRRCVQKGLKQLENLGIISRVRQHGRRIINFLINFAAKAAKTFGPKSKSGRRSEEPRPPGEPTTPGAAGHPPEQNYNPPSAHVARKLLDALEAKGWKVELDDQGRNRLARLRVDVVPEPVGDELGRQLKAHSAAIRDLIRSTRARE